jgi:2-oxoglutarate dehydrogenase E2 component (dihydrolipoamide succinyltransferase)
VATKVIMPQLGESVVEGTVTRWLKQEGEQIKEFDSLLEVNTDKVDTEIPAPASGTVLKIVVPEGETVTAGAVIAWIGAPGEALPDEAGGGPAQPSSTPESAPQPAGATPGRDRDLGFISPVVAKIAREAGVDLAQVKGSGEGGRITKKDVQAFVAARENPQPQWEQAQAAWETPADGDLFRPTELVFGARPAESSPGTPAQKPSGQAQTPAPGGERQQPAGPEAGDLVPLNPVRKAIAEHMVMSKRTSPHVMTVMEADMSKVLAHRETHKASFERDGANLTLTAYLISAIVGALKAFPLVNSSWSDQGIRLHREINVGMATSLGDEGLIVPVIKGADGLSLLGLARAINDLAGRARARKLKPDEVQGGTFTLTNHGISGSLFAMPIINQPQCAILGAGVVQKRVVVIQDAIAIRPMIYLSLVFDHRILDGAIADRFLAQVVDGLQNWV